MIEREQKGKEGDPADREMRECEVAGRERE